LRRRTAANRSPSCTDLPTRALRARKRFAIRRRRHPQQPLKRTPQRLRAAESTRGGDLLDPRARVLEPLARGFHTCAVGVSRRRDSELAREEAREIARAHTDAPRERLDGEVGIGVLVDPALELPQRGAMRDRARELDTELRLPAGPTEEEDELARDVARE